MIQIGESIKIVKKFERKVLDITKGFVTIGSLLAFVIHASHNDMNDSDTQMSPEYEAAATEIEKVMMFLPPDSPETHRFYLAGYIDALAENGTISEKTRENLYAVYAC